jgi:hypothetical protein
MSGGRRRGEHSGRGPRGYRRSDERIREDINDRLTDHDEIDAEDIDVKVSDGEVTLTGTVDSRWTKRMAEDAVYEVSGVSEVTNQLRVKQQGRAGSQGSSQSGRQADENEQSQGKRQGEQANQSSRSTAKT